MPSSPAAMRQACIQGLRMRSAAAPPSRSRSGSSTGRQNRLRQNTTWASGMAPSSAFTKAPATENTAAAPSTSNTARRRARAKLKRAGGGGGALARVPVSMDGYRPRG